MEVIGRSYLRFVQCFLLNVCIIAATVDFVTSSEHVVHFTIKANNGLDALSSIVDTAVKSRWKREADSDLKAKCKKQEDEHLIEMKNGTRYETKVSTLFFLICKSRRYTHLARHNHSSISNITVLRDGPFPSCYFRFYFF